MNAILESPVAKACATVAIEAKPDQRPTVRVWLVDDNDEFRGMLAQLLTRHGGIECARDFSSPDALLSALASQTGPDAILLDIEMRDRNGLDAIGPIKALSRDTQVLMLTSFYDDQGRSRAMAEGASDFLLKTYDLEEIVARIRNPRRRVNARRRTDNPACSHNQNRAQSGGLAAESRKAKTRAGLGQDNNSPALFRNSVRFFQKLLAG